MSTVMPLLDVPVTSVIEAIARMETIEAALPAADGLACLWAVRDDAFARGVFLDTLAASTALASRMLLVAV